MKVKVRIPVRARHIREGIPSDEGSCAIALAVRELCPGDSVSVGSSLDIGEKSFNLPDYAKKFMSQFDASVDTDDFPDGRGSPEHLAAVRAVWKKKGRPKPFVLEIEVPVCEALT